MGTQLPSPKGYSPQFSANVRCDQTARWTKMPPGMEIGLGPGDFVFDGIHLPPEKEKKGTPPPNFGLCLLWPNGWMDEDATWYRRRPRPKPHCVRRGPSSPAKGAQQPSRLFGPCLLWPRSPISATAELLLQSSRLCHTDRLIDRQTTVLGL